LIHRAATVAALIAFCPSAGGAAAGPPVLAAPQIFAPGIISGPADDGSPTFARDGNLLLFTRNDTILESHRANGRWSQPRIAAFSGRWKDSSPEFSPDGRYAVYVSIRPPDGSVPDDRRRSANLWRADRVGAGWSEPVRLPDAVNIGPSIWKPSIAADGNIYFVSIDASRGKRLYCSRYKGGAYQPAQPVSFSDGKSGDVDPEVAPDESFMVFASNGRVAGDSKDHLFIVFNEAGTWSAPLRIRYAGDDVNGPSTEDEPHFSPDLRTLYFASDRTVPVRFPRTAEQAALDLQRIALWDNSNNNPWSIPLTPLLDTIRAQR
jgi:Tol biopolymer transport system component